MSVFGLNHILTLIMIIFVCFCPESTGVNVVIERGNEDVFDGPCKVVGSGEDCFECDRLNADCDPGSQYCIRCRCRPSHSTYLSAEGRCVPNIYVSLFPGYSTSFLVEEKQNKRCVTSYRNPTDVGETVCNQSDFSQHWFWTKSNQLLNRDTLSCLKKKKNVNKLWLGGGCKVKANLWQCGYSYNFKTKTGYPRYMTGGNGYIILANNRQSRRASWQRFTSNEKLCSKESGCYAFANSYLLVADTDCSTSCGGSEQINLQLSRSKPSCSIIWNQSKYLDHDQWRQLQLKYGIFTMYTVRISSRYKLRLKRERADAPSEWSGMIIKLQFECTWWRNRRRSGCVIIKFRGTPTYPTTVPPSTVSSSAISTILTHEPESSPSTNPTRDTTTTSSTTVSSSASSTKFTHEPKSSPSANPTNYTTMASSDATTAPFSPTSRTSTKYFSTDNSSNRTNAKERQKSDPSNVITIVVCSLVVVLIVLSGILGFVFYKRRRSAKPSSEANNQGGSLAKPSSADTPNPIYSSADSTFAPPIYQEPDNKVYKVYQEPETGASQECELYEPAENYTHDYATLEKDVNLPPVREETYDYAKNDDIRSAVQQMPARGNSQQDKKNVLTYLKGNTVNEVDETPVYLELENPYQNI